MDIDIELERISNGFIATHCGVKEYYKSISDFVENNTSEEITKLDNMHRTHETGGNRFVVKISIKDLA